MLINSESFLLMPNEDIINFYNDDDNHKVHNFTPAELMEKFNLAFFEGQNTTTSKSSENNNSYDYFFDQYLTETHHDQSEDFDFNDFVDIFDRNLANSLDSNSEDDKTFDLEDETYSSLDFDGFAANLQDLDEITQQLPPITTLIKNNNNFDFNSYIRAVPPDNLLPNFDPNPAASEFGHLITQDQTDFTQFQPNQLILHQTECSDMLTQQEDPLLSASSVIFEPQPQRKRKKICSSTTSDESCDEFLTLTCQWADCYQTYDSQANLVRHIEKSHVEVRKGDEFTCYWSNCPRQIKPFNARYKLLIHMRVHSGEKPNKCPFQGCSKAFSRLENLKIHQRSHTGERPYLCQFATCTKSFSNSSDRAKHQRTHFDTKPYACQVAGCTKKYTDPSSLRKHVKNHTNEEQMLIKRKNNLVPNEPNYTTKPKFHTNIEHNYSNAKNNTTTSMHTIKQDLKMKISEKNKLKNFNFLT